MILYIEVYSWDFFYISAGLLKSREKRAKDF